MTSRPARHRYLERRITRDARVPISADDPDMENGFRAIAIPPTDDGDWFVLESSHNGKDKTVWGRWVFVEYVMTANLPNDADLATCIDSCLKEVCDVITERRDLPPDIRSVLCGAAATLAVALAHTKIKGTSCKKCQAQCRKATS